MQIIVDRRPLKTDSRPPTSELNEFVVLLFIAYYFSGTFIILAVLLHRNI